MTDYPLARAARVLRGDGASPRLLYVLAEDVIRLADEVDRTRKHAVKQAAEIARLRGHASVLACAVSCLRAAINEDAPPDVIARLLAEACADVAAYRAAYPERTP